MAEEFTFHPQIEDLMPRIWPLDEPHRDVIKMLVQRDQDLEDWLNRGSFQGFAWQVSGRVVTTYRSADLPVVGGGTLTKVLVDVGTADTSANFAVQVLRNGGDAQTVTVGTATSASSDVVVGFDDGDVLRFRVSNIGDGIAEYLSITAVFS